jgi:hypothetical protein
MSQQILSVGSGSIKTIINDEYRYVGYSIHSWGNENRISLDLHEIESSFLRPEDLEQIAHDLRKKENDLKKQLPEIGQKVVFCGQFLPNVQDCQPLNRFENGDILECIAIKKDDEGEDMGVFWNINKNLASGLVKNIGGNFYYKNL